MVNIFLEQRDSVCVLPQLKRFIYSFFMSPEKAHGVSLALVGALKLDEFDTRSTKQGRMIRVGAAGNSAGRRNDHIFIHTTTLKKNC